MKLESFFEKFDQFADASDSLEKMRELVLKLAVTGKLVTQDKRDEPALALLESAEAERAKLIAAKKIKSRPTSPVDSNEQPFDLPLNWAWARLSDVGYELGQKVPDKRFTYIDVGGIDSDKGRISDRVEKLEPGDAPSRARKLVARGTVIYSTVRPYLRNIAIVDQDFDPEAIASTAFGILHPFAGINNRYLFYWLRSAPFTSYVQAGMKGMAYPAINDEKFYNGFIPLPPLAEQKRIVAKVDELMTLCDRLELQQQQRETQHAVLARASLARFSDAPTPANLNFIFHKSFDIAPADLRKSILTLAVQGKLVPQDPNEEPAASLILRIAEEKRRLVAARVIRDKEKAVPINDGEVPFGVPNGWEWVRLSSITRRIHYGYTASAKSELNGVRLLRISDIQNNTVDWSSVPGCEIAKDEVPQYQLERGDILVARTGGTVGKTYLVQDVPVVAVFASYLIRIQGGTAFFDRYLKLFLESPTYWVQLEVGARGAAQPNVNGQTLGRMVVSVPPLAEQRRIVAKVEQLMALVDALEIQLAASRDKGQKLLEAVVNKLTLAS
ncbi:restriction endonuclease subunit S [bacterium]|nr:restriction endonuclease subunit S [bacterium]